MSTTRLDVTWEPEGSGVPLALEVTPGQLSAPLTTLLHDAGHPLNMRCGGRGLCAGCRVDFLRGQLTHIASGRVVTAIEPSQISACQYALRDGHAVGISVPAVSQLAHTAQIADDFKIRVPLANAPLMPAAGIALAIDIGTTTVAVLLSDSATGEILARATALNRQTAMGDNVVTRINHCMIDKGSIAKLQSLVRDGTILPLVRQVCDKAGVSPEAIAGAVVSANTTMLHLLAGVDPSTMGVSPFTPAFLDHRVFTTTELGFETLPGTTPIHLLPGLSAYVGADINSGIVATGMHYEDGPNLLVDIGTNGEIALKYKDRLLGCATAAGPAFEGEGLAWGTSAVAGAIAEIQIAADPFALSLQQIRGGAKGRYPGLCGSAYVDFLGEGVRHGILTSAGRFAREFETAHPELIRTIEGEKIFVLAENGNVGKSVGISELDISRLLQAKAAIASGIQTLLAQVKLEPESIRKLYLAGGFGFHMNVANAIACGLLPGFSPEQIEVVGNTSLAGAYMALQDRGILDELRQNQKRIEIVELNLDESFEDRYIENLLLSE